MRRRETRTCAKNLRIGVVTVILAVTGTIAHPQTKPAALEIVSPKGGETWAAGSQHYILWKSNLPDPDQNPRAEYTTDNGEHWLKLPARAAGAGQILWRVPHQLSAQCRVRVFDRRGGASGESKDFTIVASQAVDGYQWEQVTPQAAFAPRDGGGALVFKGKLWLLGGWNPNDKKHFPRITNNEVWSSTDGATWTCHAVMAPWEPRQYREVAVFDGRMWVLEGFKDYNRKDVWYSQDGANWYSLPKTPWDARHAACVFVHNNALWIAAGNNMAPDVWKLQRRPVPAAAAPEPAETGMMLNVAVGLFDIDDRVGHIFDDHNPERLFYPVNLARTGTTIVPIFGNIFGLNAYGLKGENIYAQLHLDGGGKMYFDKWTDGGEGLEIVIDNQANPPKILIRRTAR